MAAFDLDPYPVTEESHNAMSRCDDCGEIAALGILRYGLSRPLLEPEMKTHKTHTT
jgi:hypothetical protein